MRDRRRLRDLFIAPLPHDPVEGPTRADLRGLPLRDRRRRKIESAAQGGLFRTWVYVVALIGVLAVLALLVAVSG